MGNRLISEQDRKTLSKEFEEIEEKEIGREIHSQYHHLVEE